MKVSDLSGKIHAWNLRGHIPLLNDCRPRSELHLRARNVLKKMFPTDQILEECTTPGEQLYLDFFLPLRKLIIEVQGQQHFKFSEHFHGTQAGFVKSKNRDNRKKRWAEINGFRLIEFNYNESDKEWAMKLI